MPANTRFCAVQIEVICLHSSTHVQLRSTQLFKKRNKCTFESRSFHNMLHQHVSHVQCIMSCEVTFYVHGHFPSSSGGCGGLRNPFPKILLTEPFAVGPYCFQFSVVPGEIACSCVEPFSVQFCGLIAGINLAFFFLFIGFCPSKCPGCDWCMTWRDSHKVAAIVVL